jgi:hypothetical protein
MEKRKGGGETNGVSLLYGVQYSLVHAACIAYTDLLAVDHAVQNVL